MRRSGKILILILEGIIKKFSYERCDYESVDEAYLRLCPEKLRKKKKNSGSKGLKPMFLHVRPMKRTYTLINVPGN